MFRLLGLDRGSVDTEKSPGIDLTLNYPGAQLRLKYRCVIRFSDCTEIWFDLKIGMM